MTERTPRPEPKARLVVRQAEARDVEAIVELSERVYGVADSYTPEMITGHLSRFSIGQFVAEHEGRIVGYCATFRVQEELALAPHTWRSITGGGYASRHDSAGDWLYGMEVCVDPQFRGLRIGRRLYDRRKQLCVALGLKGIVFGGRLPGLGKRMAKYGSAENYVEAVRAAKVRDAVLSFQLRNGFDVHEVLEDYLP